MKWYELQVDWRQRIVRLCELLSEALVGFIIIFGGAWLIGFASTFS